MKTIVVTVKPNARQSSLQCDASGQCQARLKAAPVDGKANDELIALIAAHFGLRRSQVRLRHGASGRRKQIELDMDEWPDAPQ